MFFLHCFLNHPNSTVEQSTEGIGILTCRTKVVMPDVASRRTKKFTLLLLAWHTHSLNWRNLLSSKILRRKPFISKLIFVTVSQ